MVGSAAVQEQRDQRDAGGDRSVQREAPRQRDQPVLVGERDEDDEPCDPAQAEARRRRRIRVAGGESTRSERREQLQERGGNNPFQRVACDHRGGVRQPPGDHLAKEFRERGDDHARGYRDQQHGERVAAELAAEPSFRGGPRQIRDDDHAKRLRAEDEHEIDAVRAHEAVRLVVPSELVRQIDAGNCAGDAEHDVREARDKAAPNGALAAERASLGLLLARHGHDETKRL